MLRRRHLIYLIKGLFKCYLPLKIAYLKKGRLYLHLNSPMHNKAIIVYSFCLKVCRVACLD